MPRGIIETIGLAGAVLFAAPVALFGVRRLLAGDLAGVAFLTVAALMVVVPRYAFTPENAAEEAAERTAAAIVRDED